MLCNRYRRIYTEKMMLLLLVSSTVKQNYWHYIFLFGFWAGMKLWLFYQKNPQNKLRIDRVICSNAMYSGDQVPNFSHQNLLRSKKTSAFRFGRKKLNKISLAAVTVFQPENICNCDKLLSKIRFNVVSSRTQEF